jgi:hypothetical protein
VPEKYYFGILLYISFILCEPVAFSQQTDYKSIFGRDWDKAEAFIAENEAWMRQLSDKYDISFPVAAAMVFPELIRYSALQDKIEITLLKTLYINLGNDYADFSIGPFQMKPSFGETIYEKAGSLKDKIRLRFKSGSYAGKIREYRASIVKDLEEPASQFLYLICFIKICEKVYPIEKTDDSFRVKFLASAYNCGLGNSFEKIRDMADKKFFNTKLYKTENYCYSDISLYWYAQNKEPLKRMRIRTGSCLEPVSD